CGKLELLLLEATMGREARNSNWKDWPTASAGRRQARLQRLRLQSRDFRRRRRRGEGWTVESVRGDEYAAAKVRVGGEDAGQQRAIRDVAVGLDLCAFGAVDHRDARAGAWAGAHDEIGPAVAVQIVCAHADASGDAGGEGEEAGQHGAIRDLTVGLDLVKFRAVDDLDARGGAWAGADDDVGAAIAVDVARRDEDAAAQTGG